jgi:hypothetical protein
MPAFACLFGWLVAWLLGWLLAWSLECMVGCLVTGAVCGQCQEELGAAVPGRACQADLERYWAISLKNEQHWDWS